MGNLCQSQEIVAATSWDAFFLSTYLASIDDLGINLAVDYLDRGVEHFIWADLYVAVAMAGTLVSSTVSKLGPTLFIAFCISLTYLVRPKKSMDLVVKCALFL